MSNLSRPFVLESKNKSRKQEKLINTEKHLVNKLNEDSEEEVVKKTILDDSLNDIFDNYSKRMAIIVEDIVKAMNTYEPENARRHSYIGIILNMISTIFDVLTRPENIIYSGITFIFISIFVYYVFVVG